MTWIIFLLVGLGIGYWIGRKGASVDPRRKQVLELFKDGGGVFNDQVQSALGVSDATATRYLDELEQAGEIKQVGTTGRGVVYKKK